MATEMEGHGHNGIQSFLCVSKLVWVEVTFNIVEIPADVLKRLGTFRKSLAPCQGEQRIRGPLVQLVTSLDFRFTNV